MRNSRWVPGGSGLSPGILAAAWVAVTVATGCVGGAGLSAPAAPVASPPAFRATPEPATAEPATPMLGAFYHLWNPENLDQGYLRSRLVPPQTDMAAGAATGVAGVEGDITAARRAGIDFFALDWWPTRPELNRRIDEQFLAAPNAEEIQFCIFYETADLEKNLDHGLTRFDARTRKRFVADLVGLARRYFDHPGYLRVEGRPVVVLYLSRSMVGDVAAAVAEARAAISALGSDVFLIADEIFWRVPPLRGRDVRPGPEPQAERALLFDALTAYNLYDGDTPAHGGYGASTPFVADVAGLWQRWREATGGKVPVVPSVIPGYNDLGLASRRGHHVIPRQWAPGAPEGSFLARFLDDAALPAVDPRLPMVLVTSWNEWNEDTAIEPIRPAAPTTVDDSPTGRELTGGYPYSGYGSAYLDVLAERF